MTGVWRRLGLRSRLTIAATALVAVALAAGGLLLVVGLRAALVGSLDAAALQRARDVAELVDRGQLSDPIPVVGGTAAVQVVNAAGQVLAVSPGADHLVAIVERQDLPSMRDGAARDVDGARMGISDRLRVVAAPAGTDAAPRTVLVAVSLGQVTDTVSLVATATAVTVPVLVLAFALLCWLLAGSVLRPVAELRRGADEITGTGAARRLPVPAAVDEIHRLAGTLNDMLDRLGAASTRQRTFVADAAHELRNPLAAVRTQLEVARRHPSAAGWEETADGVLADVARLSRLVDDLLLLARLDDAGQAPRMNAAARDSRGGPHVVAVDLVDIATSAAAGQRSGRVPVAVAQEAGPAVVDGDADALARVVANLVDNAVRHARTSVTLDVRTQDGMAELVVLDDGPGVAAADRERVFERFTRLDEGRGRDAGGSGLGLAIVRELVRAHGGDVVLSDADPGLRAVVRLPCSRR